MHWDPLPDRFDQNYFKYQVSANTDYKLSYIAAQNGIHVTTYNKGKPKKIESKSGQSGKKVISEPEICENFHENPANRKT